ncbi:MAG TPA: hypothetical protein P5307_00535 [Pirellulaceae bacterium]|nr:hypothetical protein [Planctomycetaceae bacterium]HRX77510.1 hypothetical protein [Pirellulaceae bacterium]
MTVKRRLTLAVFLSVAIGAGLFPLLRSQARPATSATNVKVKPGDVTWHSDFAVACEASKQSGKPVLFFQLLGELDDEFC